MTTNLPIQLLPDREPTDPHCHGYPQVHPPRNKNRYSVFINCPYCGCEHAFDGINPNFTALRTCRVPFADEAPELFEEGCGKEFAIRIQSVRVDAEVFSIVQA